MALASCRECGRDVSTEAKACPLCGVRDPTRRETSGKTVAIIAGVLLVLAAFASSDNTSSPAAPAAPKPQVEGSKMDARMVCEDFVKKRLKAPSSAKIRLAGSTDEAVDLLAPHKFRVKGYYDAENSFGAMLRGYFVCDVTHTTDYNYDLDLLSMK